MAGSYVPALPPVGSAIPVALWQAFPEFIQHWFERRPALAELLWASLQSGFFGALILLAPAFQKGDFATWTSTWLWTQHNWWGILIAFIISAYRGNAARSKAATAAKGP